MIRGSGRRDRVPSYTMEGLFLCETAADVWQMDSERSRVAPAQACI